MTRKKSTAAILNLLFVYHNCCLQQLQAGDCHGKVGSWLSVSPYGPSLEMDEGGKDTYYTNSLALVEPSNWKCSAL